MSVLKNVRHESYCNLVLSGSTMTAAYTKAFGTHSNSGAWALNRRPMIQARISELRTEMGITPDEDDSEIQAQLHILETQGAVENAFIVKALLLNYDAARKAGAFVSANAALHLLARINNLVTEKADPRAAKLAKLEAEKKASNRPEINEIFLDKKTGKPDHSKILAALREANAQAGIAESVDTESARMHSAAHNERMRIEAEGAKR